MRHRIYKVKITALHILCFVQKSEVHIKFAGFNDAGSDQTSGSVLPTAH